MSSRPDQAPREELFFDTGGEGGPARVDEESVSDLFEIVEDESFEAAPATPVEATAGEAPPVVASVPVPTIQPDAADDAIVMEHVLPPPASSAPWLSSIARVVAS